MVNFLDSPSGYYTSNGINKSVGNRTSPTPTQRVGFLNSPSGYYTQQPKIIKTQSIQQPKPNFFQQAEQGISNFFGGVKNNFMPSNALPSGLKLNFVTPSKNKAANLNIEGNKTQSIKLNKKIPLGSPPKITKYDSSKLISPFNTGVTAVDLAPSTIKTLADLQVDPLSLKNAPKATLKDLFMPFSNPISNSISNNYIKGIVDSIKADGQAISDLFHAKSKSEAAGAGASVAARTVGVVFSPLTSLFSAANDIPVLGTVSKLISLPFDVLGDTGRDIAYPVANMLPISKKAKENIVGGIGEIASLALMIGVGGKIADIPKRITDVLVKKYGVEDANTIVQQAQKKASEMKQLPAPEQPKLLEAKNPQSQVQGEGFTMSDNVNKRNLDLLKAQNDYHAALRDYNRRPTPEKLAKVQQLRDKFNTLRDSYSSSPKTAKEILKPGEYTPAEVRKAVLNSPLKNTPEGNQIINHSIQAEQQGKNVSVSHEEQTVPSEPKSTTQGATPSKIGLSIEQKAIEDKLTKGFEGVAGYDKITIEEQSKLAAETMKNLDEARAIIRGEKPLPKGLRGTALIIAAEDHIEKTGDAQMAYDLANSPLTSETSAAAQEMRLAAERKPDGIAQKLLDLKKAREDAIKNKTGKTVDEAIKSDSQKIVDSIKKAAPTTNDWQSFIESIQC